MNALAKGDSWSATTSAGFQPKSRAVPESLINTIASTVCHAHRMGQKEAYTFLKQFVLEQMRVPDFPYYPMNGLRNMTSRRCHPRRQSDHYVA